MLGLALGACTGAKNPNEAGFLDGLRNQTDGTYSGQIEARQDERAGLEAANALLDDEVTSLERTSDVNEAKLASARSKLGDLKSRTARLRSLYESDRARYADELETLASVERGISRQEHTLSGGVSEGDTEAALGRLNRLADVIDSLPGA
tara:strand:+ start:12567 stop:13016 length:450 start_codon:yes stop_codon:yes gene_type:complete